MAFKKVEGGFGHKWPKRMSARIDCIDDELDGKECLLIIVYDGIEISRAELDICLPQQVATATIEEECTLIFDLLPDEPNNEVEFYFTYYYKDYRALMQCEALYQILSKC